MSHIPQRKEKDCLNCGAIVQGRYCHNCGQENVEPKETFWHMAAHFFYDITHFDSSFFHTIHHLILKPGFLSKEYMIGRRSGYLHPVRMYMFTSAIFFLLFFSLFKPGDAVDNANLKTLNAKERADYLVTLQKRQFNDTSNKLWPEAIALIKDTTRPFTAKDLANYEIKKGIMIRFTDKEYKSFEEYDSTEQTLPPSKRDGWLLRRFVKLDISITNKYRENPQEAANRLVEGFFHRLPYLLFVSLPLFALILKLVYIRRKQFYLADHGVFTIHLYVFSFIILMVAFGLDKLQKLTGSGFLDTLKSFFILGLFFYLFIAMHNFYKQGWGKTFLKFIIVTLISVIMMLLLFAIFLLFSAFTI